MRALKPLLALAGLALLGLMLARLSRAALAAAFVRVGLWALLPLGLAGGWLFANAMALYVFLPRGVPIVGLWRNRFVSEGYNNILPLLGLGGEGFKVRHLARLMPVETALAATIQERLVDGVLGLVQPAACVALGAALLPLAAGPRDAAWAAAAGSGALGLAALAALALPWPRRLAARLSRKLTGAAAPLPPLRARASVASVGWMLLGRALGVAEIALLMLRLGHPPSLVEWLFLSGAFGVVGTLAWPVPGNLGVNEAAAVLLFQWLGLPAADGMALALLRRARLLTVSSFGVALYAAERRR